jgi:hypothetical protein
MRKTYDEPMRILVPIPLHGNDKVPLVQASFFNTKYGAEITILNVIQKISFLEEWLFPKKLKQKRKKALKRLKRLVQNRFRDEPVLDHMKFELVTDDIVAVADMSLSGRSVAQTNEDK